MASTIVEFDYYQSRTLTVDTYPLKSDTADATADAATEQTNRKGKYRITITEALTGIKEIRVKEGGVVVAVYWTEPLVDDTNVYAADDRRVSVEQWRGTAIPDVDTAGYPKITIKNGLGTGELKIVGGRVGTDLTYTSSSVNDVSATTTTFVTLITLLPDDALNDALVTFTSGNLIGQTKPILSYANSTGVIVVSEPFTEAPANSDTFDIIRTHVHPVSQIQSGLATSTAQTTAQADLDILTGSDGAVIASGTQTFNMTGNVTGNLSGSVGSVTGAVGSVTGSVGSVTGAVGSVTGAVGSVTGAVGSVAGNVDGNVTGTVGSVVTKTGYSLAATGLDSITATTPAGLATTFPTKMMQLWARFFNRVGKGSGTMTNYADDGTTPTVTQTYTTSGTDTTDNVGGAS